MNIDQLILDLKNRIKEVDEMDALFNEIDNELKQSNDDI